MKKVNLAVPVLDLEGKPIEGGEGKKMMLNEVIANSISREKAQSDPIRQMDIAHAIYGSKGEIELEDADFSMVENLLAKLPLIALIMAQAKKIMNEAKVVKK